MGVERTPAVGYRLLDEGAGEGIEPLTSSLPCIPNRIRYLRVSLDLAGHRPHSFDGSPIYSVCSRAFCDSLRDTKVDHAHDGHIRAPNARREPLPPRTQLERTIPHQSQET